LLSRASQLDNCKLLDVTDELVHTVTLAGPPE
jgi:hypothetical protein